MSFKESLQIWVKDVPLFFVQTVVMFLIQAVGIVLGWLIVPVMLIVGKFDKTSEKPFTDYARRNKWIREVFPKVFWAWDNLEDSSTGDHRGWWDKNCFFGNSRLFLNRFWWLAIRNPFNNFKRYVLGCDIRNYEFEVLGGQMHVRDDFYNTGWHFVKATHKDGKMPRYMLYIVKRYKDSDHALVIQIGNKIKFAHNWSIEEDEIDYFKGFTFEVNPFKDIS